jgi:hypothetical protein
VRIGDRVGNRATMAPVVDVWHFLTPLVSLPNVWSIASVARVAWPQLQDRVWVEVGVLIR